MFQQIVPTQGGFARALVILWIQIGQMYNLLETFELSDDFREFSLTIKCFAAVLIAIDAEKYLRRELLNPVNHAPRTEVRRATRPDRANRGGRQHRDQRLRNVRHEGHDARIRTCPAKLSQGTPVSRVVSLINKSASAPARSFLKMCCA